MPAFQSSERSLSTGSNSRRLPDALNAQQNYQLTSDGATAQQTYQQTSDAAHRDDDRKHAEVGRYVVPARILRDASGRLSHLEFGSD